MQGLDQVHWVEEPTIPWHTSTQESIWIQTKGDVDPRVVA